MTEWNFEELDRYGQAKIELGRASKVGVLGGEAGTSKILKDLSNLPTVLERGKPPAFLARSTGFGP